MVRTRILLSILSAATLGTAMFSGCGGKPEVVEPRDKFGNSGGAAGSQGDGSGATGNIITGPDSGDSGGGEADPCAQIACNVDQHCEIVDGSASCVGNTCADLACPPPQKCTETDGGAFCEDNSCTDDLSCDPLEFCDLSATDGGPGVCTMDACTAGERTCNGNELLECAQNGSGQTSKYTCQSGSPYFTSMCSDPGTGDASCSCEDDWDCPAFTDCEVDQCEGTGVAPTCSLPPVPFDQVLPTNEITWGGVWQSEDAVGSPFASSAQVVLTPVVANLDDDNGDGLIDERDFPEIIFTSFCGTRSGPHHFRSNGTLRAIHGGGPRKGQDYFANCGGAHWIDTSGVDPTTMTCVCTDADLDSTASLAVGDLDYDGVPEIVAITEGPGNSNGEIRIYDNQGQEITTSSPVINLGGDNPAPTIANLDNEGFAEIVVGRDVWSIAHDASGNIIVADYWEGTQASGQNGQGPVSCIANLIGDSRQEIISGSTVYRFPVKPPGATRQADCTGSETIQDEIDWCNGVLPIEWHGPTVNGSTPSEGFCAVADVLGADQDAAPDPTNPLDGVAEVVVIRSARLLVFNGQTGEKKRDINLGIGSLGGAPNVDDFDGDGFPEIGTAASTAYVVADLQDPTSGAECDAWPNAAPDDTTPLDTVAGNPPRTPPSTTCTQDSDCGDLSKFSCNEQLGTCVCLHNGWRRGTEDNSSQVTGSSVFDFNGDGAAEVIYNDECRFRVYDGTDGRVWFNEVSESRTRIEYPVVADVDNDGNAEIVFATTNESGFCSENLDSQYNNGIEVWGDANDTWVSARRVWNQHAYHVTNVTEGGRIPTFEPESWLPYNGRLYNTYRSNPRSAGVAPDLTPTAIQVSSPDASCGMLSNLIDITVEIRNIGDLRVGPGVVVSFHGEWDNPTLAEPLNDASAAPLTFTIMNSMEPGDVILVTVQYDAANNSPMVLPNRVRVLVDDGDQERECAESNNERTEPVEAGSELPDLRLDVGTPSSCPSPNLPVDVCNDGSQPVSDVVIRCYAGDPAAGGTVLDQEVVAGPINAGDCFSHTQTIDSFPSNLEILIFCVADPDDTVLECNDGNNKDAADSKHACNVVQ